MRWADMDLLGHVNNVAYVTYLQEARGDLLDRARRSVGPESADLAAECRVVRHDVHYAHPLVFGVRPVLIECWLTEITASGFTIAYEIFHERDPDDRARQVYVRASTVLATYDPATQRPRTLAPCEQAALQPYLESTLDDETAEDVPRIGATNGSVFEFGLRVRRSDVDVRGYVDDVVAFEHLQESRIRLVDDLKRGRDLPRMHFVVARTEVNYLDRFRWRPEPYVVRSEVARLGRRSMSIESEILDGERVLAQARVTTVFYDLEAQRSTDPHPRLRERLLEVARER